MTYSPMRGISISQKLYYREFSPMRGRPMGGCPMKGRPMRGPPVLGQNISNQQTSTYVKEMLQK